MAKILATIALVGAILIGCATHPASALSVVSHSGATCHNVTGTCLNHGFVCANDEVVPHSQRCDGVEQCADGTDEFMCHHQDDTPMHERTAESRHMAMQGSCVKCNCPASVIDIVKGSAWFNHALISPTDFQGLMTGTGPYKGLPCEKTCAFTIKMAFYKKTGVCRGWLCCARQRQCVTCNNVGVCVGKTGGNRCYA